jgi:toxin FitB
MLETCLREGPQIVTKRGADAAVLAPVADWRRLQRAAKPTLKALLLTNDARGELNVPARGGMRRRVRGLDWPPLFLLDTNVVSELRRVRPHGALLGWLQDVRDQDLHLSAVTIGEIQSGIEITREQDQARAAALEAWLDEVAETYNVLSMDTRTFRVWARLMHRRTDNLIEGAMIAATAAVHHLTVVTRNVRDFEGLGVLTLNPFAIKPE